MTTRPTSFRLSDTTLARLKALAQPHEPAAQVIARALIALEAQDAAQDVAAPPGPLSALIERMDALEVRLDALEASGALARLEARFSGSAKALQGQRDGSSPALRAPGGSATDRTDISQDAGSGRATGSPHSRPDYPPEVRRLAVQLADAGTAPVVIRQRIAEACGRSPDSKNWTKVLATWRKWAAQDSAT